MTSREMTNDACWRHLDDTASGRVVLVHHGRPLDVPVNHVVDGRTIVFRTGAASPLGLLPSREPVRFEVDDDELRRRPGGACWWPARSRGSNRTFGIRSIRHRPRGRPAGSRRGCASCPPASPAWSSLAPLCATTGSRWTQHPAERDAVRTDHRRGGRVHHQRSSVRARPAARRSRQPLRRGPVRSPRQRPRRRDPGLAPTAPPRRPRSLGRGAPRGAGAGPRVGRVRASGRPRREPHPARHLRGRSRWRTSPRSHRRGDHEPRPAATAAPRPTTSQPTARRSVVPDHRPRRSQRADLPGIGDRTLDLDLHQHPATARRRHPPGSVAPFEPFKPSTTRARHHPERTTPSFEHSTSVPPCCRTSTAGTTPSSSSPVHGGRRHHRIGGPPHVASSGSCRVRCSSFRPSASSGRQRTVELRR